MTTSILLVDSDQQLTALVKSLLLGRGHAVEHFESGKEALESVKKQTPKLIVVGEQLTDIDGVGWIVKLRQINRDAKIVFISSKWRDTDLYQQLTKDFGVSLVVHRPLKPLLFGAQIESELVEKNVENENADTETFVQLKNRFASILPTRLKSIEDFVEKTVKAPGDQVAIEEVRRLSHNLKGTASSCGFHHVGETSAQIEHTMNEVIEGGKSVDKNTLDKIVRLVGVLRENVKQDYPDEIPTASEVVSQNTDLNDLSMAKVMLVGIHSEDEKNNFSRKAQAKIIIAENEEEAIEKAKGTTLDAAILDITEVSSEKSLELARKLRNLPGYETLPLAFIHQNDEKANKKDGMHAGASLYLKKPVAEDEMAQAIEYLITLRGRPRILIVDDDEDFTKIIEAALGKEGMLVKSVNIPGDAIPVLNDFSPDLLLLDVMMPGTSGYDVCRKIQIGRAHV